MTTSGVVVLHVGDGTDMVHAPLFGAVLVLVSLEGLCFGEGHAVDFPNLREDVVFGFRVLITSREHWYFLKRMSWAFG